MVVLVRCALSWSLRSCLVVFTSDVRVLRKIERGFGRSQPLSAVFLEEKKRTRIKGFVARPTLCAGQIIESVEERRGTTV
jgi:hypothetical protein